MPAVNMFCTLSEVDEIQFRLSCGIAALNAIHLAMTEGSLEVGPDALYGVYDYLAGVNKELRREIDSGFKGLKAEGKS